MKKFKVVTRDRFSQIIFKTLLFLASNFAFFAYFCRENYSKNLCLFLLGSLPFFAVKKCPEKIPKFVAGKGKDCLETSKSLPAKARLAWSLDFCCSLCRQRGKGRQSKFALAFAFFCLCHAQPWFELSQGSTNV